MSETDPRCSKQLIDEVLSLYLSEEAEIDVGKDVKER